MTIRMARTPTRAASQRPRGIKLRSTAVGTASRMRGRRSPMSRKYARQSRTAFTLVEILAVVVILGIASAVIIPQISNRDDLKAAAGTRLVTADLIFAQN